MSSVTVIAETTTTVHGTVDGDRILIDPADLPAVLGWSLRPEGLCRDEHCVPVPPGVTLAVDGALDLAATADQLGRRARIDAASGSIAVAAPRKPGRVAGVGIAPDLTLPGLAGEQHRLSQWRGRRRMLFAFASW